MCNESLYLLDVLIHRFLDGPDGSVVQIAQRKFTDMFGQTDTQPIQDSECGYVRGHKGSVQQNQSADKSTQCDPSPTYHFSSICQNRIAAMRQQLFQHLIDSPIGHKHTHGTTYRQQTCQQKQPFLLSRNL